MKKTSFATNSLCIVSFALFMGSSFLSSAAAAESRRTPDGIEIVEDPIARFGQPIDRLGEHWSGIERRALLAELAEGSLEAARERILSAAETSSRDNAIYFLLIELNATDEFRLFRKELRAMAREVAEDSLGKQRDRRLDARDRQEGELMRARLLERVVRDDEAAAARYRAMLRSKSSGLNQVEEAAQVRLRVIERRLKRANQEKN